MTYNIFISHSWTHGDQYENLCKLLEGLDWKNYSVPKDNPIHESSGKELIKAIKDQITPASCVLVLAGVYASYSKWINFEIAAAEKMDKPIIAIEPWGSERTSKTVKDSAREVVGWRSESIKEAIRKYC